MAGTHLIQDPFTTGIYEHVQCILIHIHDLKMKDDIINKFLLENAKNYGISSTDTCVQGFYPEKHSHAIED
jgi:hypothetical protein